MNDNNKQITIGLDADNVIFDFTGSFLIWFNKITGKNLKKEDLKLWNFKNALKELYGDSYYELANKIISHPEFVLNLKLKPNVASIFKEICDNKYLKVVIVTALADDLIPQREACFERYFNGLNFEIVYETNKEKIDIDYLVDDGIHNLDSLATKIPKENCLCMTEPYNVGCVYPSFNTLEDAISYIYEKESINVLIPIAI